MKPLLCLLVLALIGCAQPNPRAKALADAIARGDKELAAGKPRQAGATWTTVLHFEPSNPEAKRKISALPEGMPRTTEDVDSLAGFMIAAIRATSSSDFCGFPDATPEAELVTMRMISDIRSLQSLDTSPLSAQGGECAGVGALLFTAKPLSSMVEVRQAYGKPQSEKKYADSSEALTYGRIRIIGGRDGQATVVLLRPTQ